MAKKKEELDLLHELAKELDGYVLEDMDNVKGWVDTGNLALNYLCSGRFYGGGIPIGRVIEIFGASSTCKTLFGTNILKGTQRSGGVSIFLDAEHSLNKDFAVKASHLEASKVLVLMADSLEKAFAKIHAAIRAVRAKIGLDKPIVIVYDSIAASPSDREFEETQMDDKQLEKAKDMPGERAKTCSKELRKLGPILEKNNASVIFINQVRHKIGIMFGNPETNAGGGKSLEFYASLRLRTKAEKKFQDKLDNVIGMGVTVQNVKNKLVRPFITARSMQLYYDKGIDPVSGLLELLYQAERIEACGGGSYKIKEPYAAGQEIKFKSSMERNDVPVEVLMKCPALVDATSQEQIQEFINIYGAAMGQEIAKEVDPGPDEGDE